MPIFRNGSLVAKPLAVSALKNCGRLAAAFCVAASLCAAPIAAAEDEAAQTGTMQASAPESTGTVRRGTTQYRLPKKKIALVQFDVANTLHVDDINNIYDGLPQMLSSRLAESGYFLPAYTGRSIPPEAGEAQREAIFRIAEETGAQFLISGTVVNAGIKQEKGVLGTSLGKHKKRHIEVDLAIYDAHTGARLLQHRFGEQAKGDVMVGNNKPFGSSIFLATELGQAFDRLIDLAVKDIQAALEDVPFSAHIIRAEAKKAVLDAGSDSLLKAGDTLVAYVRDTNAQVVGLNGSTLGVMDRAAEIITLTQVHPQFSLGELPEDAAKLGIKAGNIARIDPDEQRNLVARQIAAQQLVKARQEAQNKAERIIAEQAAQVEAARLKAEQDAKAEAARIKEEKKAAAQAKIKAAADAKAAKLKARKEALAARLKAAQEARAKERAREKAHALAEAKAAKLKAKQEEAKTKVECVPVEKKTSSKADGQAAAGTATQQLPASGVAKTKTGTETAIQPAAESGVKKTGTEADAPATEEAARAKKKPGIPLKLKQIQP